MMDPDAILTSASGLLFVLLAFTAKIILIDNLITGLLIAGLGAIVGYFCKRLAEWLYNKLTTWIKRKFRKE